VSAGKTRIVKTTRQMPEWEAVKVAADVISSGGVICFPTDTTYGLAASIYSPEAIKRLRDLKVRSPHDPFVVIVPDLGVVAELASPITSKHRKLMDEYWPGPLTIVFEASDRVPDYMTGPDGSVALRIPNDVLTQSILGACGIPLAAPSANVRGRRAAMSPDEVLADFSGRIDLLLDGGPVESALPSTIVAVKPRGCKVLRRGRVSLSRVQP
jgi:L-threonylcarbamoyladenylate synthase